MLVRLEFGSAYYDIIDVPESLIDWYKENRIEFYDRLYNWLENQNDKYYYNDMYHYHREAVIEWLNDDLLNSDNEKAVLVEADKLNDPNDDYLEVMNF